MSSLAFVTHPSVRIKGTENNYNPSQCLDDRCPVKAPHLHCPFCVKTDAYQDPVILKAHYRVKHVDKGIEFAGLKILRCCDQCDIIGIIKGEKRFKGAHWHCYRCRNGFNRRDEAIKHYKTHFRNPQTTFQIQITQDLNSPPEGRSHDELSNSSQDAFASIENPIQEIIHPALSQTAISLAEQNVITTVSDTNRQKVEVKHELLVKGEDAGDHGDDQTIMIIQGDQLESAFASHIINSGDITALSKTSVDPNLSWEIRYRMEEEEKNIYKAKAEEYKAQVEILQQQVQDLETQLAQQSQMKLQELIEALSSGDTNKQGLSQQLSKFLEQCQLQCSIATNEDAAQNQQQQESLDTSDSIIEELAGSNKSIADDLGVNHSVTDHHDQNALDSNTNVTHLSEIPEGFQVICTSADGSVLITRAPDSVITSSTAEGNMVATETSSSVTSSSIVSTVVSESNQGLFSYVLNSENKDVNLHEISTDGDHNQAANSEHQQQLKPEAVENTVPPHKEQNSDAQGDQGGDLNAEAQQECLMEEVNAADGLASLGTDVIVVSRASSDQENHGSFVMSIGDNEKLFVQENNTEDNVVEGELEREVDGPDTKRMRIT